MRRSCPDGRGNRGCAMVVPARCQCCGMEGLDHRTILRLEDQMMSTGLHADRGFTVEAADEPFVCPEIARTSPPNRTPGMPSTAW